MNNADQQRPSRRSRRSTPVSQLISKSGSDLNIQKSKHDRLNQNGKRFISKEANQCFNKNQVRMSIKKFKVAIPSTPNTPSTTKKLLISKIAQTPLKFKIYNDHENERQEASNKKSTPKISISDIKSKSMSTALQFKTVEKEKLPLQKVLDLAQDHHHSSLSTTPMLKTESSNIFTSSLDQNTTSLVHQVQLPLIHLNHWYRITQHQILLQKSNATPGPEYVKMSHVVLSCGKFSDQLLIVNCKKIDEEYQECQNVLLLNYRQHPLVSLKVQEIQSGSKIALIGGAKVIGALKLYQNWKLES